MFVTLYLLAGRPRTPQGARQLQRLAVVAHILSFAICIGVGQLTIGVDLLALAGMIALLYSVASDYQHRSVQVLPLLLAGGGGYLGALGYLHYQGLLADDLRWVGPVLVVAAGQQAFRVARASDRALRETFLKDRVIAKQQEQIRAEKARSEALLLNIFPEPIALALRDRPGVTAEEHPEASVLFADLAGFTAMSSGMTAGQVVGMLNEVFTDFDLLVQKHGLEKIKTIGDCYMAASGVPRPREDHASVLVKLALEMRDLVGSREFGGRRLSFRFGVNSGPVVAGVIGRHRFIYDLWGDTVNVASRMGSHGQGGIVQVSERTRAG